ncbi:MAG: S-layer homology domain-containing protein, partial [Oscillospiraceae bacterium]|nr:S-layer homology domain-containing protein [Oscillospiraceae bacterium]
MVGQFPTDESATINEISFVAPPNSTGMVFAFVRESGEVLKSMDYGMTWEHFGNQDRTIHQPGFQVIDNDRVYVTWARSLTRPRFVYGKVMYVNGSYDDTGYELVYRPPVNTGQDMGDPSSTLMADGNMLVVCYDAHYRSIVGTVVPIDNLSVTQQQGKGADFMLDVPTGAWYYSAVDYAIKNGIMSGYNAISFGPNDTLSRAMVVQVLYNKEGQPGLNGAKHNFPDVPADQWFNNAVTWGSQKGVVSGFGDGKFRPNDYVTVEQVAVILHNYSGKPAAAGEPVGVGKYDDWAKEALNWAVTQGIMKDVPFTNATENATRAQTAQILKNFLTK